MHLARFWASVRTESEMDESSKKSVKTSNLKSVKMKKIACMKIKSKDMQLLMNDFSFDSFWWHIFKISPLKIISFMQV